MRAYYNIVFLLLVIYLVISFFSVVCQFFVHKRDKGIIFKKKNSANAFQMWKETSFALLEIIRIAREDVQ